MTDSINIKDIQLGKEKYSGHQYYKNSRLNNKRVLYKKNKHANSQLSQLEIAFSGLATLHLAKNLTVNQQLVKDNNDQVLGVVSEDLCYLIERQEGTNKTYYSLQDNSLNYQEINSEKPEQIPYYFLKKLPQGFFTTLLRQLKSAKISIDFSSLASIFCASYALEEDDLHKGNFGFYVVKKEDKPHVVFFKIDHDLMLAESVMSFYSSRPSHWILEDNAFSITAEDLIKFPEIHSSANAYWPTQKNLFWYPSGNKGYHDLHEANAFANLGEIPEFKAAKWMNFYKYILLPRELLERSLIGAYDIEIPENRAQVSLITHALIARQARLRAVLFSIPEFREYIATMTLDTQTSLVKEWSLNTEEQKQFLLQMQQYKQLCVSGFESGDTPLHVAIKLGDYRYEETLPFFAEFMNQKNHTGKTPVDVAVSQLSNDFQPDIRKDSHFILNHLVRNGAEKTDSFNSLPDQKSIETYRFSSQYIDDAIAAKNYRELKQVLCKIGEDHQFCLKHQKNLAIQCVRQYINTHKEDKDLKTVLSALRKDINWSTPKEDHAGLQYVRQLRSQLWIIRKIRGMYGYTTTQSVMNRLIDGVLEKNCGIVAKLVSTFTPALTFNLS